MFRSYLERISKSCGFGSTGKNICGQVQCTSKVHCTLCKLHFHEMIQLRKHLIKFSCPNLSFVQLETESVVVKMMLYWAFVLAVETAATKYTKSAFADYSQPAKAGFVLL